VFFGGVSYLHNFPRGNVSRTGHGPRPQREGVVQHRLRPEHRRQTQQNGIEVPGAVRTTLGNLLLGVSYRYNQYSTLNLSVGVGVTRDTPDVSFTLRAPSLFEHILML